MADIRKDSYLDGTSNNRNIKQMMEQYYNSAYPINAAFWQQASIDKRFKVGDQQLWSMVYGNQDFNNSKRLFFNMIRRHVNMITGYQRRNRKSTIVVPQSETDDALADDYTACQIWSENRENAQEIYSQTFEGSTDVGLQMMHMYLDFTNDPISGDLGLDTVAYSNFIIDPFFRKPDLSDCNFIWRRRWVSKSGAKMLLPGRSKEIDAMQPLGAKDGKFSFQAEMINVNTNKMFAYDEFYYRDFREADLVIDTYSGEAVEWYENLEEQEGDLEQILAQAPYLQVKKVQKPTVKLAIVLNDREMYDGPDLLRTDRYPFIPSICYHEPDVQAYQWRMQGVIRNMRDAQYLYNRRKVIELDILESQINSGWIYPVDSITDEKALRQTGQGLLIPLKKGHQAAELQRITAPEIPASMIELSRSLAEDMTKISGVNEELLGSADDAKAGILSMLRQSAGITTLQGIFDRFDTAQRLLGSLRLEAIRRNFTKGKVKRILGRDPHPKFFLSDSSKFDTAVEEGRYSTTQRQLELSQLLHFKELGMPIPDESIIRASFIQNKGKLIEDLKTQQQAQQQAQQAEIESAQQSQQVKMMESYAKSRSELAKAQDYMASASEKITNIEEIRASADHKRMEADLSMVKELIALEDMDMKSLKRAIALSEIVRATQESQNQQTTIGVQNA